MFRFWSSDSRGSEKTVDASQPTPLVAEPQQPTPDATSITSTARSPRPLKKRRQSFETPSHAPSNGSPAKRARQDMDDAIADGALSPAHQLTVDMERAHDAIQYQFGLEILLKHDELRLINQELAKCQIALEQLRRCHLIPYPVNCPTPEQMLAISSGKGPAVYGRPGEPLPRWAPPFGVVDGPYARHYAKWLIPDPIFDGMQAEWQPVPESSRTRPSLEGRTTRNSFAEAGGFSTKRPSRSLAGAKLQALSSGYPQPKEKAGPCVLKRADGQTVKLVCIDCKRENFSSTQGFINHCRIAHRRDFKSHEEAAVASGHPIEVDEVAGPTGAASVGGEDKSTGSGSQALGLVHPFARTDMTEQQAYRALRSRIQDSLKLYHQGKLPGITSIPTAPKAVPAVNKVKKTSGFVSSQETPYLSRLLQSRKFTGNLSELVEEAKKQDIMEEISSPGEDSEDGMDSLDGAKTTSTAIRAPVVMRVPARSAVSPGPLATTRPTSSKGHPHIAFATPTAPGMTIPLKDDDPRLIIIHDEDVDMDVDLSPNTLISNNAPSLVSDDGEYDDSDDGSSHSDASDSMDAESISDVAEINIDEDHEPPRPLRHHRGSTAVGSGTAVRFRKDDSKHVTFVSPVKNNAKERRSRKV